MILHHDLLINEKTFDIFFHLPRTSRIVDVGCGIRPFPVFPCKEHVCIEPHDEYLDHLRQWTREDRAVTVIKGEAEALAEQPKDDTTVLLIDVIEHMEKERGLAIKTMMESFQHAVIFTPLGWYEQGDQNPDCWGFNGGFWQKHRSAWQPEDFQGWSVHTWSVWHPINGCGAILAIR